MDYLKLIRSFWKLHEQEPFTGNETLLYWRLVDLFNAAGKKDEWPETLRFSDGQLCLATGLSPNTLDKFRRVLQTRKLIEVKNTGKGFRAGAEYGLIDLSSSSKRTSKRYSNSEDDFEELDKRTSEFEELSEQVPQEVPQKDTQEHPQNLRNSYIYISKPQTYQTSNKTLFVAERDNASVWQLIIDTLAQKKKIKPPRSSAPAPPSPFGDELPALTNAWNLWCSYRKEKGKREYKPIGLQGAANELMKLSGNDEQRAIAIINQSIAKSWDGFYPLKSNEQPKGHQNPITNGIGNESLSQFGAELDKLFERDYRS